MKILVTAITFAVTIGGLFLFENYKTAPKDEDYAQIVQGLANQNQSKASVYKSTNKSGEAPVKISISPAGGPTPSAAQSFTPTLTTTPPSASPTRTTVNRQIAPTPTPTPVVTPTPESTQIVTPTPTPSQQNNQITVISLTSPVKQNTEAKLVITITPSAQCFIKVVLPSGTQSSAKDISSGLPLSEPRTTDASGGLSWSWKINWNTTPGTANIDATCSKDSQNFSKSSQMIIIER